MDNGKNDGENDHQLNLDVGVGGRDQEDAANYRITENDCREYGVEMIPKRI